jgi:UDP-N-acetylglucosamine acyltransferase
MYAGVNRDVPAYVMVSDTPGIPRGINSEGLKRRDFDARQIRNIKNAYRVIYRDGLKLTEAIAELERRVATQPELKILIDSLRSSERGIIR